ncbi:Peptidoglycan recognition protein LE [Carabus blaptoides fortunei]
MEHQQEKNCVVCAKCGRKDAEENALIVSRESVSKCEQWLAEKCSISDVDSEYSSRTSISSTSLSQCHTECSCDDAESSAVELLKPNDLTSSVTELIGAALVEGTPHKYGNVRVANSEHVVIGNVTYVTGPVHITQTASNVQRQTVVNQIFLDGTSTTQLANKLRIISRTNWLAQPAFSKDPLPEPVKYVIIAHTATEEGCTQAENTLLVRLVQTFHIESRKWADISYNFLIGSDGNVYEGRGWGIQGAHTLGYNQRSLCIAFVGCFMDHLPPVKALNAAKALIQSGQELGHIPEDYSLVGHCQCIPIESPGRRLYDELKTWAKWRELTQEDTNI